jgi:flagellar biosynthetic protein FliR
MLRIDSVRPELALLALELSRITGVVVVSPVPWSNAPKRVRTGLIIFLLAVVHHMGKSPVTEIVSTGWAALHVSTEFIVGVSIGMVVRSSVAAGEIAGSALALPMGFSAARAYDPSFGQAETALGRLFRTLTLLVALISGLHRVMLGTLLSSFRLLPVGTALHLEGAFPIFLELTAHVIGVGVRLALPVLAILLMANVALGFVSRAAPSMQIFNIGFAVLLATGTFGLVLSLPEITHEVARGFDHNSVYFERLLSEFSRR